MREARGKLTVKVYGDGEIGGDIIATYRTGGASAEGRTDVGACVADGE